jgi:ABC-2 type transport system ATP-binding protein
MTASAVVIRNVWKRYAEHVAVQDLSLTIPSGTVYGLLGPNGAGKTSTIRMLLNLIVPDSGTIQALGLPNNTPGLIDRIGYLPEERGLYRRMQVRHVLRFLAALKGMTHAESAPRIDWWLHHLGLTTPDRDWGQARVDELSRGMQQKVQFIAALVHDPALIILDEPFSGLDPVNTHVLREAVLELRARGKTIIFSTHILAHAETMCDAVCIIARGRKILDGAVADVKTEYGGPPVERTVLVQPSLEDIFLQQVGGTPGATQEYFYNA